VRILGDGTHEFTTLVTDKLQEELGVTTASFAPTGTMVGGGATEVATRTVPIVEEETELTLLLVLLLFLCLYCSHNRNTRKEK
jgi:hypothetical protein